MWCADAVGFLVRTTGCTDDSNSRTVYLTYAELLFTICSLLATCVWITRQRYDPSAAEDESDNALSIQLFSYICLLCEFMIVLLILIRLYHRREYRDMNQHSRGFSLPTDYQWHIAAVITYNAFTSMAFSALPVVYMAASDSVSAGDPFTFVYVDIIPVPTVNFPVYACKYIVYALIAYIAFVESCFICTTFIHYVGMLKCDVRVVTSTVKEALANNDERKLKKAAVCHQQMLMYFEKMKMVFAKTIMLTTSFHCIYISINIIVILQTIQGRIKHTVLFLCITSSVEGLIILTIFCIYGSVVSDLHDEILHALFQYNLFYATKSFKQSFLIMMTRATIPLEFTVGYIFTINLTFYVKIIKTIYSLMNVMLASIKYISFDDGVNADVTLIEEPSTDP